MKIKLVRATILNPLSDKKCQFFKDGLLVIKYPKKDMGVVADIGHYKTLAKKYKKHASLIEDYSGQLIIPSFFDMHFHWVQERVREMPKDNLLEWLRLYTFPTEARFADEKFSKTEAQNFFANLIKTGTLGGACYSSIHEHTLHHAFESAVGDFVIGNVLMNMNSPVELTVSNRDTNALVKKLSKKYKEKYALTPRFAPTTHPDVMKFGAAEAKKNKSFIQTHLSETKNEIDWVLGMYQEMKGFEKVTSYTEIYEKSKVLGKKTFMGHGIHLSPKELKTLSKTKTAIVHCPTSNAPIEEGGLGSGLFDFAKTEKHGVRWALGSDIGAGPFVSMFDVMRSFVAQNAGNKAATYTKALYRSTLAGAGLLGLGKKKGNLVKGKEANYMVLPAQLIDKTSAEEVLKILITNVPSRKNFDSLPESVVYQGTTLFSRT
ncbi:MAG: amidohydrolase family protein [Bacteriovoracaceae bacterium]|nr:amidohydrolase family protein [Bacteriovoracaceae bacterium]